jgi:hypothetical protein
MRKILSEIRAELKDKNCVLCWGPAFTGGALWIAIFIVRRALISQNFIAARRFFPPLF